MKRYKAINFEYDDEYGTGTALDIVEHDKGEFVKYEDIKHLLQNTSDNSAMDAIRKAYIEGYSMGHHHTVEGAYWPEQTTEDWLSEQHQ